MLVTDRGQVVAELAPPGQGATDAAVPPRLLALARRNLLVIGAPADKDLIVGRNRNPQQYDLSSLPTAGGEAFR